MAAYGAVVSLQRTIECILQSSRISLVSQCSEIIQLVYREVQSLQKILKRLDGISPSKSRKKVNALDGRIKEEVWRFEDVLESHLSDQILSHHFERDSDHVLLFSIDVLRNDVGTFIETVKDMKNKYIHELDNMPQVEEDDESDVVSSSRSSSLGEMKGKIVGFSGVFEYVKSNLLKEGAHKALYSLIGMPGSGKTTLAENVFQDPEVSRWFDHRVWVTVGRKYEENEITRHILGQLDPHIDEIPQGDDEIREVYERKLVGKRCLIVLDNIWDEEVIEYFDALMPDDAAIRILLTTNLDKVGDYSLTGGDSDRDIMEPLNEKESEDLLRMKVFGEEVEDFPPRLEEAAKKIAKNCEGLPLMIVTVADLISKANKNDDLEFWNEVAQNRNSAVMMEARDQISKVLFPVYDCFPQSSKMVYLYMAAFPHDSEIRTSKLINMLTAEGFLKQQELEIIDSYMAFERVLSFTVVIDQQKSVYRMLDAIKTYRINSSWCHLFNKQSCKDRFLLLLNSGCVDALEQCMEGQRRLCLHANFVLNFKEVYNSVKCYCASTVRSLLCFGPYHPYSMPLGVGFKLLKVLDALKVRFYTFPVEILELVLLQYLALTYNGELPTSISKLFNLRFLIIHPHVSIKYWGVPSYVPVQIWDMQELEHIEISGRDLPNPDQHDASLKKLSTLLGVSIHSCNREVLERLPNIRKLGIQIELTHSGDDDLNFDYIWKLKNLEVLKWSSIDKPEVKYGCVVTPQKPIVSLFPSRLWKLYLSGLGYPWKYMEAIGEIPNLEVLKLRCYAFKGPKWETKLNSFLDLKYLVIEDADLVQWKPRRGSFPKLEKLKMKHCYKLQEFIWPYDARGGSIELVDCNPLAVICAKQLKPTDDLHKLQVFASFEGKELK
ncbi:hypothetical protein C2S52_018930 [Perilla frutescens var. hirtella]|nr:hypothetical protein C2S52_018930 [Perilla frutescens var. hirtella]